MTILLLWPLIGLLVAIAFGLIAGRKTDGWVTRSRWETHRSQATCSTRSQEYYATKIQANANGELMLVWHGERSLT